MQPRRLISAFVILACVASAMAQFTTDRNPPNPNEAAVRKVASRLTIGMPEADSVQLFTTNGLRLHAIVRHTNSWDRMCCYMDDKTPYSHCFSMTFRQEQIHAERIIRDSRGLMVMTNGILKAVSLKNAQHTTTNAP